MGSNGRNTCGKLIAHEEISTLENDIANLKNTINMYSQRIDYLLEKLEEKEIKLFKIKTLIFSLKYDCVEQSNKITVRKIGNKMERITFKQFLETYNFRQVSDECDSSNQNYYDTKIIRVYYSNNKWFEFGIYDFSDNTLNECKSIFSELIYKSTISAINYDDNLNILCVYLEETTGKNTY